MGIKYDIKPKHFDKLMEKKLTNKDKKITHPQKELLKKLSKRGILDDFLMEKMYFY